MLPWDRPLADLQQPTDVSKSWGGVTARRASDAGTSASGQENAVETRTRVGPEHSKTRSHPTTLTAEETADTPETDRLSPESQTSIKPWSLAVDFDAVSSVLVHHPIEVDFCGGTFHLLSFLHRR